MSKQTVSFRVNEELKNWLDKVRGDQDGQNFLSAMLTAYQKIAADRPEKMQVCGHARAEITTLARTLQKALNSMTSITELAEQERQAAKEQVGSITSEKDQQIVQLQNKLSTSNEDKQHLNATVQEKYQEIASLKNSIENFKQNQDNIEALKTAWQDKENSLNTRISELVEENQINKEKIKSLNNLQKENRNLQEKVTQSAYQIKILEQKIEFLEEFKQSSQEKINFLEEKVETVNEKYSKLEHEKHSIELEKAKIEALLI